jgi:arylsulfatase A-like enzyme
MSARGRLLYLGAALWVFQAGCSGRDSFQALPEGPPPRSVLLVTIDTLRADRLSCYGYAVPTSPNIARLAGRGVLFSHALSPSSCTAPSHASLMTGLYPGAHSVGVYNGRYEMSAETTTLAEILRGRGMRTAAVVSNAVLSRKLGLSQGFELYDDSLDSRELNRPLRERHADSAVDRAIAQIRRFGGEPFFVWLHLQDPHGPYVPPPAWDKFRDFSHPMPEAALPFGRDESGHRAIPRYQAYRDMHACADYARRYDSEIAFMDHELGRLLAFVENGASGTLVILTSDHGEAMGESEFFFAHSHSLGLDQVHVPLVMTGPGIPAGQILAPAVSTLTVFNTVLDYLGLPAASAESGASSLLPLVQKGLREGLQPFYAESAGQIAVVQDGVFLRRDRFPEDSPLWVKSNPNSGGFWKPLGREVLPLEGERAIPAPEIAEMEALLSRFEGKACSAKLGAPVPLTDEERKNLKSLGYVR